MREAWLNILGPKLPGAAILDLFAGSGALGLEALSRGAAHATFVEMNAPSLAALRENIASLGAESATAVVRADALRHVTTISEGAFDIALADPPFESELAQELADAWCSRPFARILAIEHAPRVTLHAGATRRWGDIAVTFFGGG